MFFSRTVLTFFRWVVLCLGFGLFFFSSLNPPPQTKRPLTKPFFNIFFPHPLLKLVQRLVDIRRGDVIELLVAYIKPSLTGSTYDSGCINYKDLKALVTLEELAAREDHYSEA